MANEPCIRVEKTFVQKTITIEQRLGLLDQKLRVQQEQRFPMHFLNSRTTKNDLKELETNLSPFEILHQNFMKRLSSA